MPYRICGCAYANADLRNHRTHKRSHEPLLVVPSPFPMQHRAHVDQERVQATRRDAYAAEHPDHVLAMVLDSQSKRATELPRKHGRNTAQTAQLARLPLQNTIGRVRGGHDYFFLNNGAYDKDSNLICAYLLHTLLCEALQREVWPGVLVLQLDNAVGENKNHPVKGLLCLLVGEDIFEKVCVCVCRCVVSTRRHVCRFVCPPQP